MVYQAAIKEVLREYDISYVHISDSEKGYRNEIWPVKTTDGHMINVTFYKREAGIVERMERADTVSTYLAEHELPTRRRFDPRTLQLKNSVGSTYVGVYTYLPGSTIPWEAYTMTHIKLLGKTMSDMHAHLAYLPAIDFNSVYDEYRVHISRMKRYFAQPEVARAAKEKLGVSIGLNQFDNYNRLLSSLEALPGQQVLHMDFVRGNILFSKATFHDEARLDGLAISGILDFEKVARGHVVMDIARTLAFLLVDCKYKQPSKVQKYFLHSGYQKRGNHAYTIDPAMLNTLMELFLIYDLYKFMRHNPYEFLDSNEHYTRTRDMLKHRNVIRY